MNKFSNFKIHRRICTHSWWEFICHLWRNSNAPWECSRLGRNEL